MEEKLNNILNKINIDYGFVDKYGIIHKNIKKKFYLENYHLESIEEIIKYNVGTCWEYVELLRFYLSEIDIDMTSYIIIYNDDNYIARHTFGVITCNNKYYLMEDNLKSYDSLEDIFNEFIGTLPVMYKIRDFDKSKLEIYEYTKPKVGLNYYEFSDFVRKGKRIWMS